MLHVTNLTQSVDQAQLRYIVEYDGKPETGPQTVLLGMQGKTSPDLITDSVHGWLRDWLGQPVQSDAEAFARVLAAPSLEVTLTPLAPASSSGVIGLNVIMRDKRIVIALRPLIADDLPAAAILTLRARKP